MALKVAGLTNDLKQSGYRFCVFKTAYVHMQSVDGGSATSSCREQAFSTLPAGSPHLQCGAEEVLLHPRCMHGSGWCPVERLPLVDLEGKEGQVLFLVSAHS